MLSCSFVFDTALYNLVVILALHAIVRDQYAAYMDTSLSGHELMPARVMGRSADHTIPASFFAHNVLPRSLINVVVHHLRVRHNASGLNEQSCLKTTRCCWCHHQSGVIIDLTAHVHVGYAEKVALFHYVNHVSEKTFSVPLDLHTSRQRYEPMVLEPIILSSA